MGRPGASWGEWRNFGSAKGPTESLAISIQLDPIRLGPLAVLGLLGIRGDLFPSCSDVLTFLVPTRNNEALNTTVDSDINHEISLLSLLCGNDDDGGDDARRCEARDLHRNDDRHPF